MRNLYLIHRCERPEHHVAPYHRVILCDQRKIAEWQRGATRDRAWVWIKEGWDQNGCGWLLIRWNGLDIDYSPVVSRVTLPDGTEGGFWRDYEQFPNAGVQGLLEKALWWSSRKMPAWLQLKGIGYPTDAFTQERILENEAWVRGFQQADSSKRSPPKHWTVQVSESAHSL